MMTGEQKRQWKTVWSYTTGEGKTGERSQKGDGMASGIIGIKFNPEATDADIQKIVSELYTGNDALISGMAYTEFKEESTLDEVNKFIAELNNKT